MMQTQTDTEHKLLLQKIRNLATRIGGTPVRQLGNGFTGNPAVRIVAKEEWMQLGGSVKARAAYAIIRDALETGALSERTVLLDATSGNTGIAYASIAREVGIRVSLCLPENASKERKQILTALGVDIIYTSPFEGTDGSQAAARELAAEHPGRYFYADQYKNDNNWKSHYHTTAPELLEQVPDMTHFVAGLGTTGTFVGTGRRLKEINPSIRLISFQPDSALHGLEGWKHLETAVVPTIYDPTVADEVLEVSTEEAYHMLRQVYESEGLLLSPSAAANIAGAVKVSRNLPSGTIVTVLPDNGDKYSEVIKKILT